jgi:lipopolysaccharide/colanic/teichoic acid biosynthesis glycosyltransferase
MNTGAPLSQRKSICIVSVTPLSVYFFLRPHIQSLSEKFDVTVVFDPRNDKYLGDLELPAKIVSISMARKLNLFQDLISLFYIHRFFKKNYFDLIVSVAPKAGLLTMIAATLVSSANKIHIFQGEFWASRKGLLRFILKQADSFTAMLANQVLAVSGSERDFLVQEKITRFKKIDVLGNGSISGVDISKYQFDEQKRDAVRQQLKIPNDAIVALFMGRVVADKGIFELVKAYIRNFSRFQDLFLLIVGPDEDSIVCNILLELGCTLERVRLVGFTYEPERYMSAADFFCLPSYREGFPISILEASAAGIPTIGTSIYGICDAIEEGKTGILVKPRNVEELSEAIALLCENQKIRIEMGFYAKARVIRHFQRDHVVKCYVDYLSNAVQVKRLSFIFQLTQRIIDLFLSVIGLLILIIPMLLIGLGIKLTSHGPMIYWSDRVGKNNVLFKMAKFRTMKNDTPAVATDLLVNPEQFITAIGRFLRKSSLDELPQLWNILKGDMSFVGPRPAMFNQTSLIEKRTKVGVDSLRPGLTGWAQVNGRDKITDEEKVKLDLQYLQNVSFLLNSKIIYLTFIKAFSGDGVNH